MVKKKTICNRLKYFGVFKRRFILVNALYHFGGFVRTKQTESLTGLSLHWQLVWSVCHFISWSSELKESVSKNWQSVISNPSQIFLIVIVPGFELSPFKMLLIVDWGTAETYARWFGVQFLSLHNSSILFEIACLVSISISKWFITNIIMTVKNENGRYITNTRKTWYNISDISLIDIETCCNFLALFIGGMVYETVDLLVGSICCFINLGDSSRCIFWTVR